MLRKWYWPLDRAIDYRDSSSLFSFIDSLVNPLQKEEPHGVITIFGRADSRPERLFVSVLTPDKTHSPYRYKCNIKGILPDIQEYIRELEEGSSKYAD